MERIEIIRTLQKFVKRDVECFEKGKRIIKHFHNSIYNFENFEHKLLKNEIKFHEYKNIKEGLCKSIDDLKIIKDEQNIQMIRIKQQVKALKKKIAELDKHFKLTSLNINEGDQEIAYKKSFRLNVIKSATKIYMDENTPPNVCRGFAINKFEKKLSSFEFDSKKISNEKSAEDFWQIAKNVSHYKTEWEKLFSSHTVHEIN